MSKVPEKSDASRSKPPKPKPPPRIDDPTAAFPIGVLASLAERDEGSQEGSTPAAVTDPGRAAAVASSPRRSGSGLQLRWLLLSLVAGAGAAAVVVLLMAAVLFVTGSR